MFAIVNFGSRQHKVIVGEAFEAERLESEVGLKIELNDISLISTGKEILTGNNCKKYKISGTIIKQYRDDKVVVFKKKRRKGYTRKRGHRQYRTILMVDKIEKI